MYSYVLTYVSTIIIKFVWHDTSLTSVTNKTNMEVVWLRWYKFPQVRQKDHSGTGETRSRGPNLDVVSVGWRWTYKSNRRRGTERPHLKGLRWLSGDIDGDVTYGWERRWSDPFLVSRAHEISVEVRCRRDTSSPVWLKCRSEVRRSRSGPSRRTELRVLRRRGGGRLVKLTIVETRRDPT